MSWMCSSWCASEISDLSDSTLPSGWPAETKLLIGKSVSDLRCISDWIRIRGTQVFPTSCSATTTPIGSSCSTTLTLSITIHLPTSWAINPAGVTPSFLSFEPPTSDTTWLQPPSAACPEEPHCLLNHSGEAVGSLCPFVPIKGQVFVTVVTETHSGALDRLTKEALLSWRWKTI